MTTITYELEPTITGLALHYSECDQFDLHITRGGIFFQDGISEINVELGEGLNCNEPFTASVESISRREVSLIYQIALRQYTDFKEALIDN